MAAALQYLESLRNANPELSDWYAALSDLYQRKLWHQLTLKLEQFVVLAVFQHCWAKASTILANFLHIQLFISSKESLTKLRREQFMLLRCSLEFQGFLRLSPYAMDKVHAALLSVEAETPDLVAA
ncbi:uncharacterized protein LOC131017242 [Salvia miltiorrhiza]|uniref:uncharacterized protein LOC131017242 n=1 Tax=Salvia miltiorrhiza TaxID=226208 RepID=UPI0025AD8667|nr:uncharacterized protein LOC131017242 [Salvia miltiorrhiza]